MKVAVYLSVAIVTTLAQIHAQDVYYYRKGKKAALKINPRKYYVLFDSKTKKDTLTSFLKSSGAVVREFRQVEPLKSLNLIKVVPNWAIIDNIDIEASPLERETIDKRVLYKAPFLLTKEGAEVGLSHLFHVKLKNEDDLPKLESLAKEHKVTILGNNKFMPLWYTLACSKQSSGNALEVANKFFESGHFSVAEPDFLADFQLKSSDPIESVSSHPGVGDGDPVRPKEKTGKGATANSERAKRAPSKEGTAKDVYYYRKGKKVALKINPRKYYVLFDSKTKKDTLTRFLKSSGAVVRQFREVKPLKSLNLIKVVPNWAIIDNIDIEASPLERETTDKRVLYKAPFFVLKNGKEVGLSHLFHVKLKNEDDLPKLESLAKEHKVTILGNNKFMPLWYTLTCSKQSSGNALEVANKFFESGHFSVAEPDFLVDFQLKSSDPIESGSSHPGVGDGDPVRPKEKTGEGATANSDPEIGIVHRNVECPLPAVQMRGSSCVSCLHISPRGRQKPRLPSHLIPLWPRSFAHQV